MFLATERDRAPCDFEMLLHLSSFVSIKMLVSLFNTAHNTGISPYLNNEACLNFTASHCHKHW